MNRLYMMDHTISIECFEYIFRIFFIYHVKTNICALDGSCVVYSIPNLSPCSLYWIRTSSASNVYTGDVTATRIHCLVFSFANISIILIPLLFRAAELMFGI